MENYQQKLLRTQKLLRESYERYHKHRPKILIINHHSPPPPLNSVVNDSPVILCKAINMNGTKCSCKAKFNGVCGRHAKK